MLEAKLQEAALLKRLLDCKLVFFVTTHPHLIPQRSHKGARHRCQLSVQRGGDRMSAFPLRVLVLIRTQELQAMDNSHVALVSVNLDSEGFKRYRCDRPMPLGVNLTSLTKVLKCAKDDDIVILNASDNGDTLKLVFEARRMSLLFNYQRRRE